MIYQYHPVKVLGKINRHKQSIEKTVINNKFILNLIYSPENTLFTEINNNFDMGTISQQKIINETFMIQFVVKYSQV